MRGLGRDNPLHSGTSAAVNALSDHGRGGVCVCPRRKPKGRRGLLCKVYQLPDQDRGVGALPMNKLVAGIILFLMLVGAVNWIIERLPSTSGIADRCIKYDVVKRKAFNISSITRRYYNNCSNKINVRFCEIIVLGVLLDRRSECKNVSVDGKRYFHTVTKSDFLYGVGSSFDFYYKGCHPPKNPAGNSKDSMWCQ